MSKKFNGRLVDQLGAVLAQKAELSKQEKLIKDKLLAQGVGAYEGEQFRATVSTYTAKNLDMDAVRAKLTPQFIAAHTFEVEKTTIKCVARNNVDVKVAA